jgi:uncharacterized membrane protein
MLPKLRPPLGAHRLVIEEAVVAHLLLVSYPDVPAAHAAGAAVAALQDRAGVPAEDIVIITRQEAGRVSLDHLTRQATGEALGGGQWGALIGTLFVVDADGASRLFKRTGLKAEFLNAVAQDLDRGMAILGLRVRGLGLEQVLDYLSARPGMGRVHSAELSGKSERAMAAIAAEFPGHVRQKAAAR